MANTFSQSYFHLVFAPNIYKSLIDKTWSDKLEIFITAIIKDNGHKLLAIKCMPDHIHIFIGYNLEQTIPELVKNIKTITSKWIKQNHFCSRSFNWQIGYGSFTHSHSTVKKVCEYISNQEEHHKKRSFKSEFISILNNRKIQYDEKYLFQFLEDKR